MNQTVANLLKHCEHPSEVEIEARLKKQLITAESIHALLHCDMQWEYSTYTEIKKISKTHRKCTYRQRTNISPKKGNEHGLGHNVSELSIICKSSIVKEDFNDMWCSVHVSIETPVPSMIQAIRHADPIKVRRYRTTIEGHYVDIIENILEHDLPRVEIEVCDPKEFKIEAMMVVVRRVCDIMNGNYYLSYYDWKTVMHMASTQYGPFCIEKMLYQKPETMTMNILSNVGQYKDMYAVTPKVDGVRKFIILANDRVYTLGIMKDVRQLDKHHSELDVTILDCEYVKKTDSYYVFDIAVYDGEYYGNTLWGPRQQKVEELVSDLNRAIYVKPYKTFDSFDSLKSLYENFLKTHQYDMDGIIFANKSLTYIDPVYKWKSHSTIDLELSADVYNGRIYAYTCDGKSVDIQIENPLFVLNSDTVADIADIADIAKLHKRGETYNDKNAEFENVIKAGVWELSYNNESNTLSILRYRPDKPQGNSWSIVQKNMYSSVPGTLFSGRGFYLMRKYHNKVKKQMIERANDKGAKILDVGTGQGGDLGKWKRASHIFCVEPSKEATEEMLSRMSTLGKRHISDFEIENTSELDTWQSRIKVINVPLRDLNISQITEKIDIFTLFFCMNQWLPEDWSKLQNIVNEKGSKKCRLLAIAMTEPEEYDSECFTIKKYANHYNISIHGTRIVDIDETPVDPITFTRMMEKSCGMTKVTEEYLDTDTFMTKEERKLSSMYTMFVYKRYIDKIK